MFKNEKITSTRALGRKNVKTAESTTRKVQKPYCEPKKDGSRQRFQGKAAEKDSGKPEEKR